MMRVGQRIAARRRGWLIATAMAGALTLTGCAQANPSVVAYVGSTVITQQELDRALSGVEQTLQPGQQVSKPAVISVMIQGRLAEQIATDRQLAISDAERDQALSGSNLAPLLKIPDAKPLAYDFVDSQIVAQRVGAEEYLKVVAAADVRLNPRFGQLFPGDKTIQPNSSGSLSTPAPTPAPTSGP